MRANEIQSSTLYQDQESRRRPFGFLAGTDYAAHFDGSTDKQRFEMVRLILQSLVEADSRAVDRRIQPTKARAKGHGS